MRLIALLALGACWGAPPPLASPQPPAAAPGIEGVAIGGGRVLFFAALPDGTVAIKRTAEVPFSVLSHAWISRDELAVLGKDDQDRIVAGTITGDGLRPLVLPQAWPEAKSRGDEVDREAEPRLTFRTTARRELWVSRCLGINWARNGACVEWAHARVLPTASPPQAAAPVERPAYTLAKTTAPPGVKVEVLYHNATGHYIGEARRARLHCTLGGRDTVYPDDDFPLDITDITWLSRDPPVFRFAKHAQCLEPCRIDVTFENCRPSPDFEHAQLAVGPKNTYALFYEKLVSVRRGGVELGRIRMPETVTQVSFAPSP